MKSIKNVLYFAENAISPIQGGGIVVYSVLKGLPPEKLLGFFQYRNITPAQEYADRFVYLPIWMRSSLGTYLRILENNKLSSAQPIAKLAANCMRFCMHEFWTRRDFQFVLQQIKERQFKPELVYFSGVSYRFMKLALMASEYFGIPMANLHMDNWMETEKELYGPFGNWMFKKIVKTMTRAATRSVSNTTNSPGLADFVEKLTGHPHFPANNCCSDLRQCLPANAQPPNNKVPVITYAGALNPHLQGETLVTAMVSAVAELNAEGTPVHLHIYSPWEFAHIANGVAMPNAIFYKGQASRENLAKAYWDSDFLLTTVTFRKANLTHFRYSLSTKLSEYLCMGKPVISAGHPDWHLHEYVEQNQCGFALKFDEGYQRAHIKEAIKKVLTTPRDVLTVIGQRNRALWEKAHNVELVAQKTRQAIGLS